MARLRCVLVLLAVPAFAPAQDPAEAARQERQVKDDTDRVVRRIGTMLRVLDYYQLDQAAEDQGDFAKEVLTVVKQTSDLHGQLPPDQQDRLRQAEQMVLTLRLRERLREPARYLDDDGSSERRLTACQRAAEGQWRVA